MTTVDLRPAHRTPAMMNDHQRMMARANAYLTVACPKCKAPREMECSSSTGFYGTATHAGRKKLIEHLNDDERIAAAAAMFAEQDRCRAAVDEAMRRKEQDPAYVAQRDATRAYISGLFDQSAESQRADERYFRERCNDYPFRSQRIHTDDCRCKVTGDIAYTPAWLEARRREDLRGTLPVTDLAAVRAARRRPTSLDVA